MDDPIEFLQETLEDDMEFEILVRKFHLQTGMTKDEIFEQLAASAGDGIWIYPHGWIIEMMKH